MHSPPRRVHPGRENEQEQNKDEVYFRDGFGGMPDFCPISAPHGPAAVSAAPRSRRTKHFSSSHVLAKAAQSGVKVLDGCRRSIMWGN